MRPLVALLTACVLLAVAAPNVRADDASPDSAPAAEEAGGAIPVEKGELAPIDGILLPESLMVHYLELDNALVEAKLEVQARDAAMATLQDDLAKAKTRSWWDRNGFWFGLATGAAAVVLAIWGTANTLSTISK